MKTRKFSFNWQSFILGVVLCAVLTVFIASKAADPQSGTVQRVLQRPANLNDVWEKSDVLEAKINALEAHLDRIDKKIDGISDALIRTLQNTKRILKEDNKN